MIALVVTVLMVMGIYSISTRLVFPFGVRSAYYVVPNADELVPVNAFIVPLDIFVIDTNVSTIRYTDSYIKEMTDGASQVWRNNANITLQNVAITRLNVSEQSTKLSVRNLEALDSFDRTYLGERFGDDVVDVIIIKEFEDAKEGGVALPSARAVFITEFTNSSWSKWNLAHEIGHVLNLYDVVQADNLMQNSEVPFNIEFKKKHLPTSLTAEQSSTARNWVYKTLCPDHSCMEG